MAKNILVTGATGNVGSLTVPHLLKENANVRALVRDPEKAKPLKEQGVEIAQGEFDTPTGLKEAFEGVDAAFLITSPNPNSAKQMHHLIEAAKQAKTPHVVRLSVIKAAPDAPTENARLHHTSDEELQESGIPYTILRPNFFSQNLFMSVETINKEGKMYWGMGDGKIGMIDVRDIAESAAKVLTGDGHEGTIYTMTGPKSISFHEIADIMSNKLGQNVEYVPVTPEDVRKSLEQMGLGEWFAQVMADYSVAYDKGWGDFTTDDVQNLTGHPARSFENTFDDVLAPAIEMPAKS